MPDIRPDELSEAILKALDSYSQEADECVRKAVDKVSKQVVNRLRANPNVPVSKYPKSGKHYRNSFSLKKTADTEHAYEVTAYNAKYRLTHILEKGRKSGTYKTNPSKRYPPMRAYPHWAEAEATAQTLFDEIGKELKK